MSALVRRVAVGAGIVFAFFGASKLALPSVSGPQFEAWGYPAWFVFVVAPSEILAGALLLVLRTRRLGALLGLVLMTGALFTHARVPTVGLLPLLPLAILLFAACAFVAWRLRPAAHASVASVGPPLGAR